MPELPEVETIRRDLLGAIKNKKIARFIAKETKVLKNQISEFEYFLINNEFIDIQRRGKLMIFDLFKGEKSLLIHLRMTGQLVFQEKGKIKAGGHPIVNVVGVPNKFTRFIIEFHDDSKLFFNDVRLFAYVALKSPEERKIIEDKYGVEPLSESFNVDYLSKVCNRSVNIKALLLDQSIIAGIGNIYADEICHASGVRPNRKVSALSMSEIKKIVTNTKKILLKSIENRGTSFSDYVDAKGKRGNFVKFLKVYGRGGKKCYKCETVLHREKIAGRTTVYCNKCQK